MGLIYILFEQTKRQLLFVLPPHGSQKFGHFACAYTLELSLDRQRVDGTLDAADAFVFLMTDEENELDFPFRCVFCTNTSSFLCVPKLGIAAIQPLEQVVSLGVDDCRVVSRFVVCLCLEQRQSIITHMTVATIHSIIRTSSTGFASSTTQLQSLHHVCLIHCHFPF